MQHRPHLIFDPELWADVQDYEGLYQISTYGRVKSLERWIDIHPEGMKSYRRKIKEKILSPAKGSCDKRYYIVVLSKDGAHKTHPVHRLVCQHFIDNHEDKEQVNHIDGDKDNNHVSNLEWCTSLENHLHSRKLKLHDDKGDKSVNAKVKTLDIPYIKELSENGVSYRVLGSMFGVSSTTIHRIIKGKRYA